ncbi:hypothetical protein BH23GEM5_BH23GEM5_22170 [soil metagenome]|jgi:hypothetical protein
MDAVWRTAYSALGNALLATTLEDDGQRVAGCVFSIGGA